MTNHDAVAGCSPWPHRMAWGLAVATFPLVWIGGLVTTTDAGMAVPDWPGTFGYNLWLYPWSTWFFGPWDLFVEHGHRLLASGVGLLTIAMVVVAWRSDASRGVRWLAVAALLLVIGQGVLGGMRVLLNERRLAMAHGSTGPLFFALTAVIVAATARRATTPTRRAGWPWALAAVVYLQVVLGAALRHVPEDGAFATFAQHVQAHLIGAGLVTVLVLAAAAVAWRQPVGPGRRWLSAALVALVAAQVSLGVATWVAKYRLPDWAQHGTAARAWEGVAGQATMGASTAGGWAETHVVTGHSAVGSLLLACSAAHATLATRGARGRREPHPTLSTDVESPDA